ncbi:unnamed protein product [Adineta steineri]|nr:unnamed protein product [Adineta steineri]
MEEKPSVPTMRSTRVIERSIFRPASTADRPYDFIIETGEESKLLLEKVERYASELFQLQQDARSRLEKKGIRVG